MRLSKRRVRSGGTGLARPSDREVVATRLFDAPRWLLWEALTCPEHVPNWMSGPAGMVMVDCEIELRLGGRWRFTWLGNDDGRVEVLGEFRDISPHERLVCTEAWNGRPPEVLGTTLIEEEYGKSRLGRAVLYPSRQACDEALAAGLVEAWSASYEQLDAYLPTMVVEPASLGCSEPVSTRGHA